MKPSIAAMAVTRGWHPVIFFVHLAATLDNWDPVHRVIPEDQLLARTQVTAARLATRNPVALAELKRAIYVGAARPLPRGLDQERVGFLSVGTTAAATRVTRAYLEDLDRLGETPYLADPKPWLDGSRVNQTNP
jgi:hypothetical protein